jgi:hypothetical protein
MLGYYSEKGVKNSFISVQKCDGYREEKKLCNTVHNEIWYFIIYDSAFAVSAALSLPFFFPLDELLPRFLCEGLDPG